MKIETLGKDPLICSGDLVEIHRPGIVGYRLVVKDADDKYRIVNLDNDTLLKPVIYSMYDLREHFRSDYESYRVIPKETLLLKETKPS